MISIGSSEVAVILGMDPFKDICELWKEKKTGVKQEVDNIYVNRGKILESSVIRMLRKEHDLEISVNDYKFYYPENLSFVAIPDAIANICGIQYLVEIKVTSRADLLEKYNLQVQWQMLCSRIHNAIIVVFNGLFEPLQLHYRRFNKDYANMVIEKVNEFIDSLKYDTCPYEVIKNTEEVPVLQDKDLEKLIEEYTNIRDEINVLEDKKSKLYKLIESNVKQSSIIGNYKVSIVNRKSDDYLKVSPEFKELLNRYNVPVEIKKGYDTSFLRISKISD